MNLRQYTYNKKFAQILMNVSYSQHLNTAAVKSYLVPQLGIQLHYELFVNKY